jgi:twitching motility protein PilT
MMSSTQLLHYALSVHASDIHLSAGEPPRLRINGDMRPLEMDPLTPDQIVQILYSALTDEQRHVLEETKELDLAYDLGERTRARINVFPHRRGLAAAFRLVPTTPPRLDDLMLPPVIRDLCRLDAGLVLVVGPTGSGKSTTLAAMIDLINGEFDGHILTIEDPIEFVHKSKRCLVHQRELGVHTKSFTGALRSGLREDPDVILIGEMRDLETVRLALTAAETGHLVFATLHAPDAPQTVDRIIDVFPSEQQAQVRVTLAETLQAVICQRLLKKRGGGRIAALEIMRATTAVRNLIREGKGHQLRSTMQTSRSDGMQTMQSDLESLVRRGLVEAAEAQKVMTDLGVESNASALRR